MKNQTQEEWVKARLLEQGFITRNQCLRNYISRLGAIMCELKKDGWVFKVGYKEVNGGKDYFYELVAKPDGQQTLIN